MTLSRPTIPPGSPDLPVRLTLVVLVALAALLPPEARGESMAGCAILIALVAALQCGAGSWGRGPAQAALAGGLALGVLGMRVALAPGAAVEPVAIFMLAGAAGIAATGLSGGDAARRQGAIALGLAAIVVSLQALYQKLWGFERLIRTIGTDTSLPDRAAVLAKLEGGRSFAGFITPAGLGGFLLLSIPVTVSLALEQKGTRRTAWFVVAALQIAAFLSAASATAAASLLGATAVAALVWNRRRRTLLIGLAALTLVLAAVSVQRGGILLDPANPRGPWQERAGNFRAAWAMAAEHPWIGVGPGGFSELYPSYRQAGDNETRHVHNLPLELGAEVGWPAAILLTALFFYLFCRPVWVERRPGPAWRKGVAIGLAGFALHNLGDFSAFMPSVLWISAVLLGLWTPRSEAGTSWGVRGLGRAAAGAALAAVLLAALVAGLGGIAADRRMAARYVSFAGDRAEAVRLAEQAVRLAPWDPDAALLYARTTEAAIPDRRIALERADNAVALSPVRPAARVLRGRLRLSVGDLEGGYADLAEAVRLYPIETNYAEQRNLLQQEMQRWMAADREAGNR